MEDKPYPLLKLPAEIWSKICELAVIEPNPIRIHDISSAKSNVARLTQQPAITRVCKSLRREGLPLFYGSNRFLIVDDGGDLKGFRKWMEKIGLVSRTRLQGLFVTSKDPRIVWTLHDRCRGRHEIVRDYRFEEETDGLERITVKIMFKATKGIG